MAKRGTLEHPKTLDLAARLEIMEPFALGLLEAFWNWVGRYCPNGDVSHVRPSLLASSIRFHGDADTLWRELQGCGFVDAIGEGRLIVHDWSDHADDFIHTTLARRCEYFADGTTPNTRRLNKDERERFHKWLDAEEAQQGGKESAKSLPEVSEKMTVPSLALPCLAMPVQEQVLAPAAPPPAMEARAEQASPPNPKLELVPPAVRKKLTPIDPRFTPFRKAIERYWAEANPGVEMPWDGGESRNLNDFLKACPLTELAAFERMLANRRLSDVVQSHRPRLWLGSLTDYANGPVDRYGKPMQKAPAPHGIVSHVDVEDPVMTLVYEADRDLAAEYPAPDLDRCVAHAESINAARARPLKVTRQQITDAYGTLFELRGRLNRILHPPSTKVQTC